MASTEAFISSEATIRSVSVQIMAIVELIERICDLTMDDLALKDRPASLSQLALINRHWNVVASSRLYKRLDLLGSTDEKVDSLLTTLEDREDLRRRIEEVRCGLKAEEGGCTRCRRKEVGRIIGFCRDIRYLETCRLQWVSPAVLPSSLVSLRLARASSSEMSWLTHLRNLENFHLDLLTESMGDQSLPSSALWRLNTLHLGASCEIDLPLWRFFLESSSETLVDLHLASCFPTEIAQALKLTSNVGHLVLDCCCMSGHDPRGRSRTLVEALPPTLIYLCLIGIEPLSDRAIDSLAGKMAELPGLKQLDIGEIDGEDVATSSWEALRRVCSERKVALTADHATPPVYEGRSWMLADLPM